jgi:acyl carrier protein
MTEQPWDEKFDHLLRSHRRLAESQDTIAPDVPFDLLGIDSLGLLGLIVDSEEVFGIEFPSDMLTSDVLATPGTFWQALKDLMSMS